MGLTRMKSHLDFLLLTSEGPSLVPYVKLKWTFPANLENTGRTMDIVTMYRILIGEFQIEGISDIYHRNMQMVLVFLDRKKMGHFWKALERYPWQFTPMKTGLIPIWWSYRQYGVNLFSTTCHILLKWPDTLDNDLSVAMWNLKISIPNAIPLRYPKTIRFTRSLIYNARSMLDQQRPHELVVHLDLGSKLTK